MSGSYNGTDLNTHYDSTPAFSGSSETDIIYRSNVGDFGSTNFIGYSWCDNYTASTGNIYDCDQQYVNLKYTSSTRSLACHETGHGVGLLHGTGAYPNKDDLDAVLGCMRSPNYTANQYLGRNQVDNINPLY